MTNSGAPDFWTIDVMAGGVWRCNPHAYERTLDAARNRADAVHHWAKVRVVNIATRECWQRAAGGPWSLAAVVAAVPDAPRAPLRSPPHAVPSSPLPVDGVPDDQLQWWQK